MSGRPVWLASLSRQKLGRRNCFLATGDWKSEEIEAGYRRLCWALRGVGDESMERLFRMNITLCLHRAATAEEVAGLPSTWKRDAGGLAGGPVEVLWSRGCVLTDSCRPCEAPNKVQVVPGRPDLWFPEDCGLCPPCQARKRAAGGELDAAAEEYCRETATAT